MEPIATTVAGLEPDTAANSAQASTALMPRPPRRWPTMAVAKLIMRRATPPWVRKLPARMKNGIAMISNFSMPVNIFSATDSSGTSVKMNMKLSTVRPSATPTGMPIAMRTTSRPKITIVLVILACSRQFLSSGRLGWVFSHSSSLRPACACSMSSAATMASPIDRVSASSSSPST